MMHVCVHVYVCVCVCVHVLVCVHVCMCVHACVCVCEVMFSCCHKCLTFVYFCISREIRSWITVLKCIITIRQRVS